MAFAARPALSFLPPISKARHILGILTGVLLVLSSGAHSFLGWRAMTEQLAAVGAPDDLVTGLAIGWHFAGMSIFLFGVMVIMTFVARLRGLPASLAIPRLIAIGYTVFGLGAYKASGNNFFMTVFVVPGVLTSLASWGGEAE